MRQDLSRPLQRIEKMAHAATSGDAFARDVGNLLATACEADAHVFLRLDPDTSLWVGVADRGHEPDSCSNYKSRAFLRSRYADFGWLARQNERLHVVTRGQVDADAYTELYLEGYGFAQELHLSFAQSGCGFGQLVLSRRRGEFSSQGKRLLEASVPSVTQHLRRLRAKEMLEAAPGESVGLISIRADGPPFAMNVAGHELLSEMDRVGAERSEERSTSGCDRAAFTTLAVVLELARRQLRSPTVSVPRAIYVSPTTQRRYRLTVERLLGAENDAQALLMAEPVRSLDSVELLRVAGLTSREAEAALLTVRGFKSAEGATALGMSEHTFLSHLKSVYKKLGVGSRSELAALVLSGM